MSAQTATKRVTAPDIAARKGGEPIVCLTAYDAPTAAMLDPHVDLILVGDSLGMVVHGLASTVGVTLDMMILHAKAVMRGASRALVAVDLPFGSYEASPARAFESASRVMGETGCQAVKVESGPAISDTVRFLVDRGIPVMGHVGLRPQAVNAFGGFKARGREEADRAAILESARATDEAGAFAIVVEAVQEDFARAITEAVAAPTIGIGASPACDGQVLVTQDLLGVFDWAPKFVKRYADLRGVVDEAVATFAADVRARRFPGPDQTYAPKRA